MIAASVFIIATQPMHAQQQTLHVPASVLDRYVGEWVYPDGNTIMLRRSGDSLFREIPGQRIRLIPLSETLFRMGAVFTAEFVVDRSGGLTQVLSDGAATEIRLRRKGSPPEPRAPATPAVRVPRSVLEQYTGVYEYIPGQMKRTDLRIHIGLRGDTLTTDAGGPELVLTPISETRFKVGSTEIMVEFVIDDAGVTQVMGTGFQQMLARLTSKR